MTVIRVACLALAVLASAVPHAQTIQFKGKIYAAATVEDCLKQSTPTNGAHCVRSADHIYTIESLAQDKTLSTLTSGDSVYVRVRNKRMSVVKKDKETQYKVLRVWMVGWSKRTFRNVNINMETDGALAQALVESALL